MPGSAVRFELCHVDRSGGARSGLLHTPHGSARTPAFMPVGTRGSIKGLTPQQVRQSGAEMILANSYHLALRPSAETVAALGGIHRFMGWEGPILTDSGGFQIFSLGSATQVSDKGVVFRSPVDGVPLELTPERAVEIQEMLGSDIAMVLDHVVELPNSTHHVRDAAERTIAWAARCQAAARREDQALFAIVQGGMDRALRLECAERLCALDFPGYAIGGLSVGEPPESMYAVLDYTVSSLPADRPRYLMGVGRPEDIVEAIARGVDLFDCVMPTRNGRNGLAFTDRGPVRLRNQCHRLSDAPLDADTPSLASPFSRGYLRHLFLAGEMLGPILVSAHNLAYYQRLMREARQAIEEDRFGAWKGAKIACWREHSPSADPGTDDPCAPPPKEG